MYRINTFHKMAEEDDYQGGVIDKTACESACDVPMQAATVEQLVEQVRQFFGVDSDALVLDSCEEAGRIDVSTLEDADGHQADPRDIEQWKVGAKRLWTCTYTGYVYECKPFELRPRGMLVSLDGGVTWLPAPEGVRVQYPNCYEEVQGTRSLLVNCTHEGLIMDETDHHDVTRTNCFMLNEIREWLN